LRDAADNVFIGLASTKISAMSSVFRKGKITSRANNVIVVSEKIVIMEKRKPFSFTL